MGNDVWSGSNAAIMQEVNIGEGIVIAAGAVVTKDVASYLVVGGVPAKFIKFRLKEQERKEITRSRWWE